MTEQEVDDMPARMKNLFWFANLKIILNTGTTGGNVDQVIEDIWQLTKKEFKP